jgi:hypothetical protein
VVSVEMHRRHPTGCRRFNFAVTGAKGPRGTVYSRFERTPAVCTRFRCRRHRLGSPGVWGPRAPSVGAKGPGEHPSVDMLPGRLPLRPPRAPGRGASPPQADHPIAKLY